MARAIVLLSCLVALSRSPPARALAAPGQLDFVVPDGFVEVTRDGARNPAAPRSPQVDALADSPGVKLVAVKTGDDGGVLATFQVKITDRPSSFSADNVGEFADQLAAELAPSGLKMEVKFKEALPVAGRPAARVALAGPGRRILFYGVPDGPRTALLLYAASERDFPALIPAFERSAKATHVVGDADSTPAASGGAPAWPRPSLIEEIIGVLALALIAAAIGAAMWTKRRKRLQHLTAARKKVQAGKQGRAR